MPDRYLPGAEVHQLDDAPMAGDGGARAGWHITWDKNASAAAPADLVPFDNLLAYFTSAGSGSAPHLLWDPFTGRVAQMFSATSRSKSFVNAPGGVETNRKGNVCIQIEIVFFPYCRVGGKVYATVADTPCVGLDRIMAWLRSWDVPDVWPMGAPTWNSNRNPAIWNTRSGHYGHSQVPENDHTDPGPMPDIFQEDDMPSLDDYAAAVWSHRLANYGNPDAAGNPRMQPAQDFQVDQDRKFDLLNGKLEELEAKLAALGTGGGAVDVDALAAAVASKTIAAFADALQVRK